MLASDGLNWLSQWSSAASLQGHDPHFLSDLLAETANGLSYTGRIFYFSARNLQLTSSDDTIFTLFTNASIPMLGKRNLFWNTTLYYCVSGLGIKSF